jgi:hypothetical protein
MSIFWLLLSKRALLQMANKFMRAGLLTMVELQSSHWTPKQQSVLREMLKVYVDPDLHIALLQHIGD